MRAHVRTAIRRALAAALRAHLPEPVRGLVFVERVAPLKDNEYPSAVLTTIDERTDDEIEGNDPEASDRHLTAVIDCSDRFKDPQGALEKAEAVAAEVEAAVSAERFLGGLLRVPARLMSTDLEVLGEGGTYIGTNRLEFDLIYRVPVTEDEIEDWFNRFGVRYNLGNAQHVDDQASDLGVIREGDSGPS